jgi:4-hydroxybenzoate polyprenyltransferase
MDERKDLQKDLLVNPGRPLPRGLVTRRELDGAVAVLLALLVAIGAWFLSRGSVGAATAVLAVAAYLCLMDREFFVGQRLSKHPLPYAIVHQLLIVPLYVLPFLANDGISPIDSTVIGFVLANFGVSMCFEIGRKLDPAAPERCATYLQAYGPRRTTAALAALCGLALAGAGLMHVLDAAWPVYAAFLAALPVIVLRPARHRIVEGLAVLQSLATLWALALFR